MTFVGKILVIVQVILSVCFMAFGAAVFTVHVNWKHRSETLQKELKDTKGEYALLEEEYANYKTDLSAQIQDQTDRANELDNEKQFLGQENKNLRTELDTTKTERDSQKALALISGDEAKIRRDEAIKQRVANAALHTAMNELNTQMRVLQDELFNKQLSAKLVATKYNKLLEQWGAARNLLATNNIDFDANSHLANESIVEDVVGVVLETKKAARSGNQLLRISIGSDDGLAKGHDLYVYRTGLDNDKRAKYLGMIKIVYVTTDQAVGEVIKRAKNGVIEVSDNVSTKL